MPEIEITIEEETKLLTWIRENEDNKPGQDPKHQILHHFGNFYNNISVHPSVDWCMNFTVEIVKGEPLITCNIPPRYGGSWKQLLLCSDRHAEALEEAEIVKFGNGEKDA